MRASRRTRNDHPAVRSFGFCCRKILTPAEFQRFAQICMRPTAGFFSDAFGLAAYLTGSEA